MPLVSVVIPSFGRPELVLRAIESVLTQTHREVELLVVVDGPDPDTISAVQSVSDKRLQMIVNPCSLTAAGARNAGADLARGEWIAFLDDDDAWLPEKLEKQIAFAAGRMSILVTCLSRVVTPITTYIWPRIMYDNATPIDEYLFDRKSMFMGSGFIQTSSYLLPRMLFDRVRFDACSPHDDWDFLLRLSKQAGARIETLPEVLVSLYVEEQRATLTSGTSWRASLRWLDSVKSMITPRAYSGFCLCVVGARAAKERAYSAFPRLLYKAVLNGSPRLWHLLLYLAFWASPGELRRQLRALVHGQPAHRST
jgi:glycosyltransferase involved in cell wall biosynthesis